MIIAASWYQPIFDDPVEAAVSAVALTGCTPADSPAPSASASIPAVPTPHEPSATAVPTPTASVTATPVTQSCGQLISATAMYSFNPNFVALGAWTRRPSASDFASLSTSPADFTFSRTPPISVLWVNSGDTILTTTGKPMRAAACAASAGVRASALFGAVTPWRNLVLAGDWTDTGLPATIEGALRSGETAADVALSK